MVQERTRFFPEVFSSTFAVAVKMSSMLRPPPGKGAVAGIIKFTSGRVYKMCFFQESIDLLP